MEDAPRQHPDLAGAPVCLQVPQVIAPLRPSRRRRRVRAVVWVALAGLVLVWAAFPSPYLAMSAGPAPRIEVSGGAPIGEYHYSTVRMTPLRWGAWWWRQLSGGPTVLGSTDPRLARAGVTEMVAAKAEAWRQAGRLLGGPETGAGVTVLAVETGRPAAAAGLRAGDVIVTLDGAPVHTPEEVVVAVEGSTGPVIVGVVRDARWAQPRSLVLHPDGVPRTVGMRINAAPAPAFAIRTGTVRGPSGGLMFTLAYLEARGGGELTNGRRVAGSGTIEADGTVGPVGGLPQKLAGARRAGAQVFFVPASEHAEIAGARGITVVPVATAQDALAWLCARGGRGPACRALAAR